jgi:hypothetical protein
MPETDPGLASLHSLSSAVPKSPRDFTPPLPLVDPLERVCFPGVSMTCCLRTQWAFITSCDQTRKYSLCSDARSLLASATCTQLSDAAMMS